MNKVMRAYWIAKSLGSGNLLNRIWWMSQEKLGILRRRLPGGELTPKQMLENFSEAYSPDQAARSWQLRRDKLFPSLSNLPQTAACLEKIVGREAWQQRVGERVAKLSRGTFEFFFHKDYEVGWPVRFDHDPVNNIDWPVSEHWTTYKQFDPRLGDIKGIWEASRFAFAYLLARHGACKDMSSSTSSLFWQTLDMWDTQNVPGRTVAWACAQESAIRMMAWIFAACSFLDSQQEEQSRYHRLSELIWHIGHFIEIAHPYAKGQKNNHAITEAAAMLTIGLLFPEFKRSSKWLRFGKSSLVSEVTTQFYEDGSYVQHSLNYHRLTIDVLIWSCRLAEINDCPLPPIVRDRLDRATNWLLEMIDPATGRAANYGANDGTLVLPLSTCDYTDFRPVAQAAYYLLHQKRCFEPGPWDEKTLWLFGPEAMEARVEKPKRKTSFAAPNGGYYILRGPDSWAMTRCHTYRDRPSQADMLHVDLWCKGVNILRDAGSYMYYCQEPWNHYFLSTAAHNTVEIDNQDQMIKGPRFLWSKWTKANLRRFETSPDGRVGYFEGEHYGYTRLPGHVIHRRTMCRIDDAYIIVDDILGSGRHEVAVRWRLCPANWRQEADTWHGEISGEDVAVNLTPADEMTVEMATGRESPAPEGWQSEYYGQKEPAPTLVMRGRVDLPVCMVSIIAPADMGLSGELVAGQGPQSLLLRGMGNGKPASTVRDLSGGRIRGEE